jgi:hypothetical protein
MGAFPARPACLECRINRPAVRIRGGDRSVYACSRLDEKIGWMKNTEQGAFGMDLGVQASACRSRCGRGRMDTAGRVV